MTRPLSYRSVGDRSPIVLVYGDDDHEAYLWAPETLAAVDWIRR